MTLTHRTEYALRLLMLLAVEPAGHEPVAVPEAARRLRLSSHHLAKIAQDLARIGLVEAVRGRQGGLLLAPGALRRGLGAIVRDLEPVALAECQGDDNGCVLTPGCRLAAILDEAGEAFFASLDRYTLGDLVAKPVRLRRLLAG